MHLYLKLVNGEEIEQTVETNVCVIGRSAKCDVVVPQEGMSRQHCQIELIDGEVFITDLGSTNGVLIDGVKIEAHKQIPYQTFLTLSFGAVQSCQIELEDPAGGSIRADRSARNVSSHDSSATGVTNLTKTRTLATPGQKGTNPSAQLNLKAKSAAASAKNDKSQMIVTYVLIGLILAGVAWWYSQKESDSESPVIIEDTKEQIKEPTAKPYESF